MSENVQNYRVEKSAWSLGGLTLAQGAVFAKALFTEGAIFKNAHKSAQMSDAVVEGSLKIAISRGHISKTSDKVTVGKDIKVEEVEAVEPADVNVDAPAKAPKAAKGKKGSKKEGEDLLGGAE